MNLLRRIAFVLLVIGGLNWLLIGIFSWDLVQAIFGLGTISTIIYILVGLSAILQIFAPGWGHSRESASAPQM